MNSSKDYRLLDHTADLGLEAWGTTVNEAFIHAAEGLFSILVEGAVQPEHPFSILLKGESLEELLVQWLNKLIYIYDAEKMVLSKFKISTLDNKHLVAEVFGEPVNFGKHKIRTYVKAATYHQAKVTLDKMCKVQIFFDV